MNDTARVLLVAAVLSAAAVARLAWRLQREEPDSPERLIGELRLARWLAVLVCGLGAMTSGLAVGSPSASLANVDAAAGLLIVGVSGLILQREPPEGLLIATIVSVALAVWNLAHRPGWLDDGDGLAWYRMGAATYAVCLASVSYLSRRR